MFIVGPTAVGKSDLALEAAAATDGWIVNADSVQCYDKIQIGAAKPSRAERERVKHLLFDWCSPPQTVTAGEYRRAALEVIGEHLASRHLFFVGGSGFYFRALEFGMFDVPPASDEVRAAIEAAAEIDGWGVQYERLNELDPETAKKISENDHYRVLRALEVVLSQGRPLSEIQKEFKEKQVSLGEQFPLLKVGLRLDRELLRERVRRRTQKMLATGLIAEVKELLAEGLSDWAPLQSVGYKECQQFLNAELDEKDLEDIIVQNTMRLAKRQMTWFKKEAEIQWFDAESEKQKALDFICERLKP